MTPTSPQNGVEHVCFMQLALLGGFYGDFEIWVFKLGMWCLQGFPPLRPKNDYLQVLISCWSTPDSSAGFEEGPGRMGDLSDMKSDCQVLTSWS